ncbi:MAG: aminodeoxychorismate synthase component I [Bacteroidales bacterium]|nr:aminodeoxychorismate synthase component I [Bacteroidales bacterium]
MDQNWENYLNELGKNRKPFLFVFDFLLRNPLIYELPVNDSLYYKFGRLGNSTPSYTPAANAYFYKIPVSYSRYKTGFDFVQQQLQLGNSFLVNYTLPTEVQTNYSPGEIFTRARAPYKLFLSGRFVVFSPETFVRIDPKGSISSFPMKGTIDANIPGAEQLILSDAKEMAEHFTMVDLIRNDLSRFARNVHVRRLRYIDKVETNQKKLLQVSSEITGELGGNYHERIGSVLASMLPAGSVSGAPKNKTVEIILEAEQYSRGYYTGIMGIYDGKCLDSAVMIRYIEITPNGYIYKSGGGITIHSDPEKEYQEMIDKVYVPFC